MKHIMTGIGMPGILLAVFFMTANMFPGKGESSAAELPTAGFGEQAICLGVGKDETEMLVTWQGTGEEGHVNLSADKGGGNFQKRAVSFPAETAYENDWGTRTFRAVLSGLIPGETYRYQVVDSRASDIYTFYVPETGSFSFLVNGDPQLEQAADAGSMAIYDALLTEAAGNTAPAFIMTLGDQANAADEEGLFARYLNTELPVKYPIVPLVGNHEEGSDVFSRFFYMPNMDDRVHTSGDMSGDYWFFRNQVLFVCLNSNIEDMSVHEKFIEKVKADCAANGKEPKWIVGALHESVFSAGLHAVTDAEILPEKREKYTKLFQGLGADIVFMAHDHSYVRTYPMDGVKAVKDAASENADGREIVYITLNSSTGTKYYDLTAESFDYAAVCSQNYRPGAVRADVTDQTFSVTAFYLKEDNTVGILDYCVLTK